MKEIQACFLLNSCPKIKLRYPKRPPVDLARYDVSSYTAQSPGLPPYKTKPPSPLPPLSKRPSQIPPNPPLKTNNLQTSIALSKTSTFMIHHSPVHSIQLNFASPFTASPLPSPLPAPALPPPFPGGCGSGGGYCRRGS